MQEMRKFKRENWKFLFPVQPISASASWMYLNCQEILSFFDILLIVCWQKMINATSFNTNLRAAFAFPKMTANVLFDTVKLFLYFIFFKKR